MIDPWGWFSDWVPEASGPRPRQPVAAVVGAKRLGNGVVRRAVVGALFAARRVLTVAEVQAAVEERLAMEVVVEMIRADT